MTLHTKLSYIKSGVRIVGYLAIGVAGVVTDTPGYTLGAILLILAECLGIAEEAWPGAYKGTDTETK